MRLRTALLFGNGVLAGVLVGLLTWGGLRLPPAFWWSVLGAVAVLGAAAGGAYLMLWAFVGPAIATITGSRCGCDKEAGVTLDKAEALR